MNTSRIIWNSLGYYRRFYALVGLATIITIAVIVGSMLVGDSVRQTLVSRVNDRLGHTESIVYTSSGYLDAQMLNDPLFESAKGVIYTKGFVSDNQRLIPVNVWGVDGLVEHGETAINAALQAELPDALHSDVVLRLAKNGLVPSGTLFVTQNYTTSMRLECVKLIDNQTGGNVSLLNDQIAPLNIFVSREELTELLEIGDKINVIMSPDNLSETDLANVWKDEWAGLQIRRYESSVEVVSDRVFLTQQLVDGICQQQPSSNRLFSYLANSIRSDTENIPYSFVTAIDSFAGHRPKADEIILSDYASKRLNVRRGDTVSMSYFISTGLKHLSTDSISLVVGDIIPISDFVADGRLSADFPGLSNVERCTDWDSDLPIDMDQITDEDEDYWTDYKSTPKALVSYEALAPRWSNVFGAATAVRLDNATAQLNSFSPSDFGVQIVQPRQAALEGAMSGVDFAGLFMALGFFIIVAALLLFVSPLQGMYAMRSSEFDVLQALGFGSRRLTALLYCEALPIVILASILGVAVGVAYTAIIMFLLGNLWQGATQTSGLGVYLDCATVLSGWIIGLILVMSLLYYTCCRSRKVSVNQTSVIPKSSAWQLWVLILSVILIVALAVLNVLVFHSVVFFVVIGCLWMCWTVFAGKCLLQQKAAVAAMTVQRHNLMWSTLYFNRRQALVSFLTLSLGVFTVFAVGLNRRDFSDAEALRAGTGGFSLWAESTVPIYYDLNTQQGRDQLSLNELPAETYIVQCLRYQADDASCLNLNRVQTPTVLGTDLRRFLGDHFGVSENIFHAEDNVDLLEKLDQRVGEAYPVLLDETVLTWGLMLSLGDTLHYQDAQGQPVDLIIAGSLPNTIMQGSAVMSDRLFAEIWPQTTGSEVILLDLPTEDVPAVQTLISTALSEYGVLVQTTASRLQQFYQVTDTYLSIFMSLGGLGLLLGLFSFFIILRKDIEARCADVHIYYTLGYSQPVVHSILFRENIVVSLSAVVAGIIGSLASVGTNAAGISVATWILGALLALILMGSLWYFTHRLINKITQTQ